MSNRIKTRSFRPWGAAAAALTAVLATAEPARAEASSSSDGSRSFEITGVLGQDAPALGSATSARHAVYGVSVAYVHTAHPESSRGLVVSGTLAYAHTTSDGNAFTAGKVGLDAYLLPAATVRWRRGGVQIGMAADYRLDVPFIDLTPQQSLAGLYPGYLAGFFVGPSAAIRPGRPGSTAGRFVVELGYQWGAGTRVNANGPDGFRRTVDLGGAHDARGRLSFAATPHLMVGLAYQRTDYPVAVSFAGSPVPRLFDQRHRGLVLSVGLVSR